MSSASLESSSSARANPSLALIARELVRLEGNHDLRNLQNQLSQRGLSSLGRSESCVLSSLLEVSERARESLAMQAYESAGPFVEKAVAMLSVPDAAGGALAPDAA